MVVYTEGFKARMVRRLTGPEGISASALAAEVGVAQPTLSRWARKARMVSTMSDSKGNKKKSPRQWTTQEKLAVVLEASQLSDEDLGKLLREKGLHRAQLEEWRQAAETALQSTKASGRRQASPEQKRIKELEKELRRKEKALAEAAALLVLKKKAQAIWGDEDGDTSM